MATLQELTEEMNHCTAVLLSERAENLKRPSYLLKPRLFIEGDQWCALYGANLQDGVAGFGSSPEEAYRAFDRAWAQPLKGNP